MCYSYTFLSLSLFHYFILFLPSLRSSHAFYNNERKGFASSSSSVLRSKLQHRRRRSITSGVDRSERRRQRGREGGRVQNPLGNQSSTILHCSQSDVAAAKDEQEFVKKRRKRIRTRFDAAAAAANDNDAEAAKRKREGETRILNFNTRGQQVKCESSISVAYISAVIVSHHIGRVFNMGINKGWRIRGPC